MDIILTPRLRLRTPLAHDLSDLHEHVLSDADVMRLAFSGTVLSLEQTSAFFSDNFDHDHSGRKLGILTERGTDRLIGFAGLMPCGALGQADYELGFVLRRDVWGRGYATEIGRAQLAYGFDTMRLGRVLALASPQNHGSIATLRKIGMVPHSAIRTELRGERLVYAAHRPGAPADLK